MDTIYQPVLLAEDDEDDRLLVMEAWQELELPNPLYTVPNGQAALAFLCREPPYQDATQPGLILLDWHLPLLSGEEVLARVRQEASLATLPVVVLTSIGPPPSFSRLETDSLVSWHSKPLSFQELCEKLYALWQRYFGSASDPMLGLRGSTTE